MITLTTDFGTSDWFVGTMKGVVYRINPRATVVDITHEIPPGDVRAGAFALMASYRYFPKGTVHVAVVDPGVGNRRRAIAVKTANYVFVGPDNGVLSWALAREKINAVRQLENEKHFAGPVSRTFHGRDVFAPVAAPLSRGLSFEKLGRALKEIVHLPWPKPSQQADEIRGEIVYIDRFGNAITNIEAKLISKSARLICEASGKKKVRCVVADFYGAVPLKRPVAVIGSSDLLEIAVNGDSAARQFGLKVGDMVQLMAFPQTLPPRGAGAIRQCARHRESRPRS